MDEVRVGVSSCSSEAVQAQSRDTVEETAASSSSGWRPRELAFAAFVPRDKEEEQQEDERANAAGKFLKYRAFVRRPVSLCFFYDLGFIYFVIVGIALVCDFEFVCVCCEGIVALTKLVGFYLFLS
jgi:hypothetical protein